MGYIACKLVYNTILIQHTVQCVYFGDGINLYSTCVGLLLFTSNILSLYMLCACVYNIMLILKKFHSLSAYTSCEQSV